MKPMDDETWEKQRVRSILAAIQTGRRVFADSDGVLRYADGDREPLADDVGLSKEPLPLAKVKLSLWSRVWRWIRGGA